MKLRNLILCAGVPIMAIWLFAPRATPAQEAAQVPPPPPAEAESPVTRSTLGTELPSDTVVQYDPETNSVIVITDEATNSQIRRVVESLDKPVPQVLIKVLFVEVTHSNDLDLGVEWSINSVNSEGVQNKVSTDFGVASATGGGVYRIVDSDFSAVLRALATTGKTEILSRPAVLTRNNETATITVGQEIPFITNSRITDTGQTINTVEYEDVGIILEVTPHITADRVVEMEVYPEISTLTADTVPISDTVSARVIAKRSAQTRVAVQDGKTVVIGGLMQDIVTETVNKVPLVGDIPVVGALFRRTESHKEKTELLIFLTPTVMDSPEALDRATLKERENTQMTPMVLKDSASQRKYDLPPVK